MEIIFYTTLFWYTIYLGISLDSFPLLNNYSCRNLLFCSRFFICSTGIKLNNEINVGYENDLLFSSKC